MQPILYILMRTDMESLNPGKAVAQGSHATSLFEEDSRGHEDIYFRSLRSKWAMEEGFGTTIVLGVNSEIDLKARIETAKKNHKKVIADVMIDPTYPLRDGNATHLFPVASCGYIFGAREDIAPYIEDLELY